MAIDSKLFPLQNAIKKILDNPTSRPELPGLKDGSSSTSKYKFYDALYSKAFWGSFKKDRPSADGKTIQYSARLWDADEEGWEEACANAPAIIKGQWFDRPTRCKKIVSNIGHIGYEMWGEFDVKKENSDSDIPGGANLSQIIALDMVAGNSHLFYGELKRGKVGRKLATKLKQSLEGNGLIDRLELLTRV